MLHILAATLSFTIGPYEADSLDCTLESTRLESVAAVRLYGAPRYHPTGMPWMIRQKPAVAGPDTLNVEDSGGWTYWVTAVDQAGNESCRGAGITVGVPQVGVPGDSDPGEPVARRDFWIDLQGRTYRHPPSTPGVYWKLSKPWSRPQKIIVM